METEFIQNGIEFLNSLTKNQLIKFYKKANDDYYNLSKPILKDSQFDILKEYIETKYPNAITIGAPVKKKVKLPFFMASMNKIKPNEKLIESWLKKYNHGHVISAKIDGISALLDLREEKAKLYTRGDGRYGQDISHILPYLKLPTVSEKMVVRGELIISKSRFPEVSTIRNIVSGIVNSKTVPKDKIGMVDFVAYEIVEPQQKPLDQMNLLYSVGFTTVLFEHYSSLNVNLLSEKLIEWRNSYQYNIDGIIVSDNEIYKRKEENPKHSFAFKMVMTDQMMEATVLEVQWNISKDGYMKPKVKLEPVFIGGVKIEYATAFNANFVKTNNIGVGTVVQLIRSGDVIPHILKVIEPTTAMFPTTIEYIWNETHVDIVVKEKQKNPSVQKRQLIHFFKGMNINGLGEKTIEKLYQKNFNTIPSILFITLDDLKTIDGIEDKISKKIFTSITEQIKKTSLAKILSFSNIFERGVGEKKLNLIFSTIPDWYETNNLTEKISNIKGFTMKSAEKISEKIPKVLEFINEAKLENKLVRVMEDKKVENLQLEGKIFVFTGIRDKKLEQLIQERGGKIGSSISKTTSLLIVKSLENSSNKIKKAKELNIPIKVYEPNMCLV